MGGRHSHNHLDLTDSDSDQEQYSDQDLINGHDDEDDEKEYSLTSDEKYAHLRSLGSTFDSLSIGGRKSYAQGSDHEKVKLYRYVFMGSGSVGGSSQKSPWIVVEKEAYWAFRRERGKKEEDDDEEADEEEEEEEEEVEKEEKGRRNRTERGTGKGNWKRNDKENGTPKVKQEEEEDDDEDEEGGVKGKSMSKAYGKGKAKGAAKAKTSTKIMLKKDENDDEKEKEGERDEQEGELHKPWFFLAGNKVRSLVSEKLQTKFYGDKLRVDFVSYGHVWSVKFRSQNEYKRFEVQYRDCLFENTFGLEATEGNKMKAFGKDFVGWAKPEEADESIWEDAEENFNDHPSFHGKPSSDKSSYCKRLIDKNLNDVSSFDKRLEASSPLIVSKPLQEAFVEPCRGGTIQSLTMGVLDHSFLVSAKGIEVMKNLPSGIHSKGIAIAFDDEMVDNSSSSSTTTPKKAMLIKRESNLMILSPSRESSGSQIKPYHHSNMGLHQVDIESGKVVAKWKFEKDGTPIQMRDVTNETKNSQLDTTRSTFLGLDDNRLCRWDMRDPHGVVEDLSTPVLNWAEGHQFSKGTNFQCFATTGDGAIVVGSKDGKVRLYGTTSMRMAKTAFPGLGSPITNVDVTYDGKWILATTDSYMILISSVFRDKDGKMKTGFSGRMGNNIAAPRLLKLSPLDAHLAGKGYKFHGGQFSWVTESGREERNLVASVGKFTVVWNFRRVKESNHECYRVTQGLKSCYCYRIIPKEESVVDSKFMHDSTFSSSPILVATPKKVSCFNI